LRDAKLVMPKNLLPILAAVLLLAVLACTSPAPTPTPTPAANSSCQANDDEELSDDDCPDDNPTLRHPPGGLAQVLPTPAPAAAAPAQPMRVESVAEGLSMPLGLIWTPDGRRMFFSEVMSGQIRVVQDGVLRPEPFLKLPIAKGGETGMLGLAVDPDYNRNHFIYAYHSDPQSGRNHVLRIEDRDGVAGPPTEIMRTIVVSQNGGAHNAGRLAFGRDNMLYVSVGNGQNTKIGQDACKLGGKILRVNRNGERASDDPFDCSPTYALGFRNPFGLAIHPLTGAVFATDNGGRGHDELDLVKPGANYGHPIVEGAPHDPRFVDPLWHSDAVSIGPTGLTFYTGDRLPEFKNDLFFCGVHTGQLSRVRRAAPNYDRVEAMNVEIMKDQIDCRLDVANGPDGALYFSDFSRIMRLTR
jgi:glucose/arabinose dehydrogenase